MNKQCANEKKKKKRLIDKEWQGADIAEIVRTEG